jgi:hypothetical protein
MEEEMCRVNSCTINSILRETKYFQTLTRRTENILTTAGCDTNIVDSGRATIVLPMGTQVTIENALLYPDSTRTLLSYRDIRKNMLHVITHEENNKEFLHTIKKNGNDHDILKRIHSLPSGLYYIYIKPIPHVIYKIIGNSSSHNLNLAKFAKSLNFMCTTCTIEKLILRPSPIKIKVEPLKFLEQIQGDMCGPIKPLSGPLRYL